MSNHDLAYQAPKLSTAPCLLFFFFVQVIGPEAQLTRERMRLEVQVYGEWMQAGWNLFLGWRVGFGV